MSRVRKNIVLGLLCLFIISAPFLFKIKGEYSGADDLAEEKIQEISKGYEPWVDSLFKPKSSEIESFLFSCQAAMGAGFIGFFIGRKTKK